MWQNCITNFVCRAYGMTSVTVSIRLFYSLFNKDIGFRIASYALLVANVLWSVREKCVDWLICQPADSNAHRPKAIVGRYQLRLSRCTGAT